MFPGASQGFQKLVYFLSVLKSSLSHSSNPEFPEQERVRWNPAACSAVQTAPRAMDTHLPLEHTQLHLRNRLSLGVPLELDTRQQEYVEAEAVQGFYVGFTDSRAQSVCGEG